MEKEIKLEVGNLLLMCINANQIEGYNVFFDFYGHVNSINIRIIKSIDDEYLFNDDIYIKGSLFDKKKFKKAMKVWRNELANLLKPDVVLSEA